MFLPPIVETLVGTTLRTTWVNSGVAPSSLSSELLDPNDQVIGSAFNALTNGSSGNGHYFAVHVIPTSYPWYVNRWWSFIDANTYQHRQLVRAHKLEA